MTVAIVSGASGFIGRRLCERLKAEGWAVHALTRGAAPVSATDVLTGVDISERPAVLALQGQLPARADVMFHLAGRAHVHAETTANEDAYKRINVEGTANLLALASVLRVRRFVFAGSVAAMGPVNEPCDETYPCSPTSAYGRSKHEAELLVREAASSLEPVVLRFPMVFGGKDRGNMTRMVDAVRRRRFPPFPETGNRRSMLHVEDAVSSLILAATHPGAAGETFIVTDGRFYSTREVYQTILRVLGRRNPLLTPPLAMYRAAAHVGDVIGRVAKRRMPLDSDSLGKLVDSAPYLNEKIVARMGFQPKHSLADGISSIISELT